MFMGGRNKFPEIKTERLVLRRIAKKDGGAYNELMNDNEANKYWGYIDPNGVIRAAEDSGRKRIEKRMARWEGLHWVIGGPGEEFVGEIFLCDFKEHLQAEVGYRIARSFWGKGYATEALSEIVRFGFSELGLSRIVLKCFCENEGSRKVAEKVGFRQEGLIRKGYIIRVFADHYIYGLLKEEWNSRANES